MTWLRFLASSVLAELRLLRSEPSLIMVLVAIPVVYPLVLGYLYEQNQVVERPALLIDHDNSALSRELTRNLDAAQEIRVMRRLDSLDEGWAEIRRQKVDMLVYVPSDFSSSVKRGEQAHIKLWVNSGNMLTFGSAFGAANAVVASLNERFGREFFLRRGMGSAAADKRVSPVVRVDRLLFHPTASYGAFFVPGVLLVVVQQVVLIGLAFSAGLQREKSPGAPAPRFPLTALAGKALAQLTFYLLGAALIVFVVMPRFGWGSHHSGAMFVLFAAFCLSVIPIGLLIASLVTDRYAAFQVLMLVSAPAFLVSGFSWPLEQMPVAPRMFASLLPSTPALLALRTISMKTADLAAVQPQITWLVGLVAFWSVLALVVVRRSWRPVLALLRRSPRKQVPTEVGASQSDDVPGRHGSDTDPNRAEADQLR